MERKFEITWPNHLPLQRGKLRPRRRKRIGQDPTGRAETRNKTTLVSPNLCNYTLKRPGYHSPSHRIKVVFLPAGGRRGSSSDLGHGEEGGGYREGGECPVQEIVLYHILTLRSYISLEAEGTGSPHFK